MPKKKLFKFKLQLPINIAAIILLTISFTMYLKNSKEYHYERYSWNIVQNSDLIDCDCIALSPNLYYNRGNDEALNKLYYSDLLEEYHSSPVVDKVYGFDMSSGALGDSAVSIRTAYKETYDLMNMKLSAGKWFDSSHRPDDYPEAVVNGALFCGVNIGDVIDVKDLDDKYDTCGSIKVRVIGKTQFPYSYPSFRAYLTDESQAVTFTSENTVFLLHDDITVETMKLGNIKLYPEYSYVYVHYSGDDKQIYEFRNHIRMIFPLDDPFSDIKSNAEPVNTIVTPGKKPTTFYLLENIFSPANLSCFFFSYFLITALMLFTMNKSSYSLGGNSHRKTTITSIIRNILILTIISFVIPWVMFNIIRTSKVTMDSMNPAFLLEYFTSESTILINISYIIMWTVLNAVSVILPIMKTKSIKRSTELSKESYIYKPAEYYSEYEERDFEVAAQDPPKNK